MVKNARILRCFEDRLIASEKVNIKRNYRILNALYQEAVALGIFPLKDPLEGIENDIRLAKILNSVTVTMETNAKKFRNTKQRRLCMTRRT